MSRKCKHLRSATAGPMPDGGCGDCLAMGDEWVHLRYCVDCGHTGCCDASNNQHARKHATTSAHPVVRSKEPGEYWAYCFEHDQMTVLT